MTILQRVKAGVDAFRGINPRKNYANSNFLNFTSGYAGQSYPQGDIRNSPDGFATAYISLWYIRACVDLYAQMAQDIPSKVIFNTDGDPDKDKEIATSEDIHIKHKWYQVESEHRIDYGLNIIPAMVYQLMLYDMLFVEKIDNAFNKPYGARVLNTLGMTIDRNYGSESIGNPVRSYQYSWNGANFNFKPEQIAYEHGFNPFDDLLGSSIIASVINQLNIDNNLNRFLRAFFINDARPSLVASPTTEFVKMMSLTQPGLTEEQIRVLQKVLTDDHKGVRNAWRPLIPNVPLDFTVLDPPNVENFTSLQNALQLQVLAAFGVNPSLLGMTEKTNYKEGIEIRAQFINDRLKPVLSQVEAVINMHLLPFLTGSHDYRFEFDFTAYHLLTEQDVIRQQMDTELYQSGGLSLNDYIERQGGKVDEKLDGLYLFNGVPVPIDEIRNLWKYTFTVAPSVYNSELITGDPLPQPADPNEVIPTASGGEPVSDTIPEPEPEPDTLKTFDYTTTSTAHIHVDDTDLIPYKDYSKAFYAPLPSIEDRVAELKALHKFVRNGTHGKRTFDFVHNVGDVADSLQEVVNLATSKNDILDAIDTHIENIKAIQSSRIEYELEVEDLVEQSRNRTIPKNSFQLKMMQAIRAYCIMVFIDGLRDGGVLGVEPDDTERSSIESHVQRQRQYVNDLADRIYSDTGISDAEALQKPAMWFNKSVLPMYEAGKASADKNGLYEWVYGAAEEHCSDCIKLNGQRHRMKTYFSRGITPGSDLLSCKGFNCKCRLVRVSGSARGRLPNI